MVDLLGYKKYAVQGGDWVWTCHYICCTPLNVDHQGWMTARIMSSLFPDSIAAVHFNMFRGVLPNNLDHNSLSETERFVLNQRKEFDATGYGYFLIQSTKVCIDIPRDYILVLDWFHP